MYLVIASSAPLSIHDGQKRPLLKYYRVDYTLSFSCSKVYLFSILLSGLLGLIKPHPVPPDSLWAAQTVLHDRLLRNRQNSFLSLSLSFYVHD